MYHGMQIEDQRKTCQELVPSYHMDFSIKLQSLGVTRRTIVPDPVVIVKQGLVRLASNLL